MPRKSANADKSDLVSRLSDPFCPPDLHQLPEEHQTQYRAVVAFIYVGAAIIFGFGLLNLRHGNRVAGAVQHASVAVVLAMLLANRRGHPRLAAHVCVAMTTITIFIGMWMGGGMSAAAVVFLPMIPAVGFLSVGQAGGLAGALQAIGIVALVAALEKLGFEPRHDPPDKLFVKRVAESITVVMQISLVCFFFFRLRRRAFRLLAKNRDELTQLFDGMRQGVLAFGPAGRVVGQCSNQAKSIFGRAELEDAEVIELLYRDVPAFDLGREQFVTWLESVFVADHEQLADMMELAPDHSVPSQGTPEERHLRLEFRPILNQGRLARVMLLVTDETEQVRLKREADAQRAAGQRALERMQRLAAGGAHGFLDTLRAAELRLAAIGETFRTACGKLSTGEIDVMFRAAHTVKGDARLYDLDALGSASEQLEELLQRLRSEALASGAVALDDQAARADLLLRDAQHAIASVRDQLVAASPIGDAILDQATVRHTDLRALRQQVTRMQRTLGEQVTPLFEVTARLLSRPFGESVAGLSEAVERWSAQQGKRASLQLAGKEIAVSPELHEVLPGVLGHLVRNAVVHGVEPPDERLRTGKGECGAVRITCESSPEGPRIVVEDDGAGIDVEGLKQRANALQLAWSEERPFELVFVDGLSTAPRVDALSGRGVGMSAVQAELRKVGYTVRTSSERALGTRFVLEPAQANGTRPNTPERGHEAPGQAWQ